MGKPNRKRLKLAELQEAKAEEVGGREIEFETSDGKVWSFPSPHFWPDEVMEFLASNKIVEASEAMMGGPERYAEFRKSGGQSSDVQLVLAAYTAEQGVKTGESGASSSS